MPTPFSRLSRGDTSRGNTSKDNASHRLSSSRCPECGAPVDFRSVPREQVQVKCAYCGTLMAIPGRGHTPPERPRPTVVVAPATNTGGAGCGVVGWSVLILIFVVGLIGISSTTLFTSAKRVFNSMQNNTGQNNAPGEFGEVRPASLPAVGFPIALGPKLRLVTAPILLGGNDNAAAQMVVAAYQDQGSILVAFDPERRAEAWRSPLFSEKYYEMGVGADGARVYVADGATLIALDRANGQTLWQTSLANNIQTACEEENPCLQIVGEQVVTLARDGTIQAFAGATGAPLWSYRLNSQPRRFLTNNDQVIVIDTDANNRAVVLILNARNGDRIFDLQPSCTFPNITMRPHTSDQFLVTPDGSSLLVVGSGTYACAWRYSLADGALVWSYTSPDVQGPLPFSWSMSSLALADPALYFVKEEGDAAIIYALDSRIAEATPQPLYSIEDYEVTVQYALGDLLMVSATPTYARDEVELWAIERSSGERRWQRKLGTEHTFDEWVTRPTDQGIFLALCFWNVDECRFEVLDLTTGTSQGQVRVDGGTPFDGGAWRGHRGYLTIDGALFAVDLRTAQIEYTWP